MSGGGGNTKEERAYSSLSTINGGRSEYFALRFSIRSTAASLEFNTMTGVRKHFANTTSPVSGSTVSNVLAKRVKSPTELLAPLHECSMLVFHRQLMNVVEERDRRRTQRTLIRRTPANISDVCTCDKDNCDEDGLGQDSRGKLRLDSHTIG